MSTDIAQFFPAEMEIQLASGVIPTHGMVSGFGVSRMLFPVSLLEQVKREAHQPVAIKVGEMLLSAVLVQQFNEQGMSYGARFQPISSEQTAYLQARLSKEGVAAGWIRKYPRIPVQQVAASLHPARAKFPWLGKAQEFELVNFSTNSFRLRGSVALDKLKVGKMLTITIVDSAGNAVSGLEGEVRNYSLVFQRDEQPVTEIGLRILESGSPGRDKYQELVKKSLVGMRA